MPRNTRFVVVFAALVLSVVAVIVFAITMDEGSQDDADRPVATAPASVPATPEPDAATQPTQTGAAGGGATSGDARIVADGHQLLPVPSGGLARFDGAQVRGVRLIVVAVTGADTFEVGRRIRDTERLQVRQDSSYAPQPGDRVNLAGVLRRSGQAPNGGYVQARSVVPEGTGPGVGGDSDVGGGEEDRP